MALPGNPAGRASLLSLALPLILFFWIIILPIQNLGSEENSPNHSMLSRILDEGQQ